MSVCRDCGADIVFARTQAGKLMPLDPERREAGDPAANVAVARNHLGTLLARVLTNAAPDPEPFEWLAIPHFATCLTRRAQAGKVDGVIPLTRRTRQGGKAL